MRSKKPAHEGPHLYRLLYVGKKNSPIYKCMMQNCPHFITNPEFVINRVSRCTDCSNEVLITEQFIRQKTICPRCDKCREKRDISKKELILQSIKEENK